MVRVHGATIADEGSAVGSDIVLVRSELTTLSGDSLQFLLSWSISVANVHEKSFIANTRTMEPLDNIIANVSVLKAVLLLATYTHP